jgi:hypothetical protein
MARPKMTSIAPVVSGGALTTGDVVLSESCAKVSVAKITRDIEGGHSVALLEMSAFLDPAGLRDLANVATQMATALEGNRDA